MNINEHYTVRQSPMGFLVELTSDLTHLSSVLGDHVLASKLFRSFYETPTGLRIPVITDEEMKALLAILVDVELDHLLALEVARKTRAEELAREREAFLSLSAEEFGKLLESLSNNRLRYRGVCMGVLRMEARELMAVTHFKKLARLGEWDATARIFEYSLPFENILRDNLFDAASALGRSTKKVTQSDIAERRAARKRKQTQAKLPDVAEMDFSEYEENFGLIAALAQEAAGKFDIPFHDYDERDWV